MTWLAVVRHRRVHVHLGADPVADVLPHDPVPAAGPRARLDRVRDVAQPVSGPGLGQAGPQRPLTGPQQRGVLVADRPDADGAGGVTVPAIQDRAAVDRDQVSGREPGLGAGDAVHDLVVDRGADRRRVPVVPLERGDGTGRADLPLGDRVQVLGGDAGLDRGRQHVQRVRHHQARLAHRRDLARRLDLDRLLLPGPHGASGFPYPRYRCEVTAGSRRPARGQRPAVSG